jgi:hypothetical protein
MKIPYFIYRTLAFILMTINICHAQDHYATSETIDKRNTYLVETCKDPYHRLQNIRDGQVVSMLKQSANNSNSILSKISDRELLIAMPKIIYSIYASNSWIFKNNQILYGSLDSRDITKIYLQTWDEYISGCVYFFP